MATNYTFAQACAIINDGTNMEAIADIGRRYPILLHKVSQVTAIAGDKFVDLMGFMPEYLTANKVNTAMKATGSTGSSEDDTETEATNDADDAEATVEAGGMPDYESMSGKQLWDILGKAGKRKTAKSTKKADLVAACKALHDGGNTDADEADDTADNEAEAESTNAYEGKSAMELFKLCKQRGIKAAPKKAAKYYVDLLTKADAEASNAESEDEDWDEDEATEEKETKSTKKSGKTAKAEKTEKKSGKKTSDASEDDGDDDWDI